MAAPTVVIMAAGQGTRMRSRVPKTLHPLCGRPLFLWPVAAAREAGAARIVVVGGADRALEPHLPEGVELATQEEPRGTGDAIRAAASHFAPGEPVIVLSGDVPLIPADLVRTLGEVQAAGAQAATVVTMEPDDPTGYGRVVRGPTGSIERIVETKAPGDASDAELAIREVNTGIYAFDPEALAAALEELRPDNVQGEYYLPDVIPALRAKGLDVASLPTDDHNLTLGINDRVDLARVRAIAQRAILERHLRAGVTIVDPASTLVDVDVELGPDTVVEPGSSLKGATRAGDACRIGPHTTLIDARLEDGASVVHSYADSCLVGPGATVGPFAYLRPGTELGEGSKAGTFVEIKNSHIGARTKVPHLSYLGDADVGEDSNIGASNITANYDGRRKHRTTIGDRVKTAVDTAFVAPVTVGDEAWTAAGSVITEDVPPGALGVARARQSNIEGYAARAKGTPEEPASAEGPGATETDRQPGGVDSPT